MISSIDDYCSEVEGILDANLAKLDARNINENINEEKVLSVYDKCKKYFDRYNSFVVEKDTVIPKPDWGDLVLNPNEINYLNNLNELQSHNYHRLFSNCMNDVIQTSYDAGYNDFFFVLDDRNTLYGHAASNLVGRQNNPINFTIKGKVYSFFGKNSNYVNVSILGDVNSFFGNSASNLKAFVRGDVSYKTASDSINMSLFVDGNVSYSCGRTSVNFMTIIKGDVDKHFGIHSGNLRAIIKGGADADFAKYCSGADITIEGKIKGNEFLRLTTSSILKSSNIETINSAKKLFRLSRRMIYLPIFSGYNRLIHVEEDGNQKLVARFT